MSLKLSVRIQTNAGQVRLHRLGETMRPRVLNNILRTVASRGMRRLMDATPRGLTGRLKKAWRVVATGKGWTVTNIQGKIVLFLDQGTRAHGPVRAKVLFIALTKRAVMSGWTPQLRRGVDYVFAKRVRGIRALNFVSREADWMREASQLAIQQYIRNTAR
jgi:hypothetical protein